MVTNTIPGTAAGTGFVDDARLPARDRLLDEAAMATVLGSSLGLVPTSCRRLRTKYRIGESLRVGYQLVPRSGPPVQVSLRCFAGRLPDPGPTSPDLVLEELGAFGWVFPNDRKLHSLSTFWTDREARRRVLKAGATELDLVAYAPEKSATIRCSDADQPLAFAKLYGEGRHRAAATLHRHLGPLLIDSGVGAPEVIGSDDQLGLVVLSPLSGSTISSRHTALDWYRLGRATARLHSVEAGMPLHRFERATMPRLQAAAQFITTARPDVGSAVGRLLEALERGRGQVEDEPDALLHGDLHGKNVLATDEGLGFIDLDQASVGPAASELGSAIAALRYDSGSPATPVTTFETHLLEGYAAVGRLPSRQALSWHIAAALLGERALRAVNRVRLGGLARLDDVVQAALHTVEQSAR